MRIPLESLAVTAPVAQDLRGAVALAERALEAALAQGAETFVLTYSGGKDSTATTVLTLEWWKRKGKPVEIHVVYADTGLEIPTLHAQALAFLEAVKRLHPGVHVHTARPRPEESFWVQIIGKGYPPPHNRFRWCTRRLKIAPMDRLVQSLPGKKAILTGVRFGESDARDQRLILSCSRGGECGQGVLFQEAKRLNALYVAPIAFWRECFVWDYLNFVPLPGLPHGGPGGGLRGPGHPLRVLDLHRGAAGQGHGAGPGERPRPPPPPLRVPGVALGVDPGSPDPGEAEGRQAREAHPRGQAGGVPEVEGGGGEARDGVPHFRGGGAHSGGVVGC